LRDKAYNCFGNVINIRERNEEKYLQHYDILFRYIEDMEKKCIDINNDLGKTKCEQFLGSEKNKIAME